MPYLANLEPTDAPDGLVTLTGPCSVTGKPHSVRVPSAGVEAYAAGALVQVAFPDLSVGTREFLVSGTSPEGWRLTFGAGEDPAWL